MPAPSAPFNALPLSIWAKRCELLAVSAGVAAFKITRMSYLGAGWQVEFTRFIYRGDAYDFVAELGLNR